MELTSFAAHAAAFLLSVSLKTVPIFAVAGLVCLGLQRASAASRHLLWAMTLVSLLCLPVFCVLLPPLAAPVLPAPVLPAPLQHRAGVADDAPQVQTSITSPPRSATTPSTDANFVPAPAASRLSADGKATAKSISPRVLAQQFNASDATTASTVPVRTVASLPQSKPALSAAAPKLTSAEWLLAIWLIGMTLVLGRMILGLLGAARLVRRSVAVASKPLAEAAEEARRKLGLKTSPSVRDGSLVAVPMTFGIVRPIVLLPAGAQAWPTERLEAVILHEMGHIKRGDWLTAMLAEVTCALYWFHPLVWLAARQLRTESEQACDDLVLTSGIPPTEYAGYLLEVVRGLTKRRGSMPAVVTMACKQDITARIKTILATSKNRSAATGRGLAVATLVALVILLPLASVRPVAFAQAKVREQAREVGKEQVKKIQPFTGISDLTVGKPQWDQKLADGTRVRLMSVGAEDVHGNIVSYWTPDGLWKQKGDVDTHPSLIYGQRVYQFFYAITFASAERQNTAVLFYSKTGEQGSSGGAGERPWHDGEPVVGSFPTLFPENQTKGTVLVHVATGPETTLIATSPLIGAVRRLPTGETVKMTKAVVRLFPAQHHLTQTTEVAVALPSRFVQDMSGYSFYPVDRNGKRINVQHAGSNIPDTTKKMAYMVFDFRTSELPLSRVKEFRFAYRPSQTATFRDVALRPNSKPVLIAPSARALGASKLPAASSSDSMNAPAVVNAVGGLAQVASNVALQLVAASDKPWDNRQWWRPDGTPFIYSPQVFRTHYSPPPRTYPQEDSELLFRLTQPKRGTTVEGWQFIPGVTAMTAGFSCVDIANGSILSGNLRKISEGPKTFGVRLRVGAGPWRQEQVRLSPAAGATTIRHSGNGWNGVYEVQRLSATATKIAVMPAAQNTAEAMRVVAFDYQGRQYLPGPSFSGMLQAGNPPGPRTEYPLAVPLSQIKKLIVETRPYRYVDFRNIARQPITSALSASFATSTSKEESERDTSLSNLHQIGLAVFHYAAAHDEHFPDAAHWMDQITPYLVPATLTGAARQQRIAAVFHSPSSPAGQKWCYAYNRALSGLTQREIDAPNQIVAAFESSRGVRNASDSGQSVPNPGWHQGGSDYVFTDAHVQWFGPNDASRLGSMFIPVIPAARREIPIRGQVFDSRTHKPVVGTWVIFSKSPNAITAGSVWPSSFTDKAGRFQSMVYPVKNYLMVLENNRFKFADKTVSYEANGNRGSISTQGTKAGPPRSAQSDYIVRWTLPQGYGLAASQGPDKKTGASITAFTPIAHSAPR